jgi:hypothetical protein
MVEMYNCEEGSMRHRTAPTRFGFSAGDVELALVGEECHTATRVMPWCGSVIVSL